MTTEYSYNKDQSVVSLMTAKKDGMLITQNTYAYDENGNQIQKTEKGIKTTYAYDSLNQIKAVVYDEKVTELFDYDAVGNRIKRTLQGKEENYYYNNKNQLLQIDKENDTIFYKYDNQGNTLEQTSSKGTTTYQYDIYNRTRQVTTENGDTIKNKYDPLGFRYKKEVNGETHNYIFDGWSITAETNKDGELKSREVRGYGLVKKEIDNNQYYYHQNEHGDITHLTNIDEEIENSYQYDVFGNIREQQENVENVFKYAGEQLDSETQQYYLRARFYNPVIARFTQEDVYRGDGLNLYVYVVNNPLLWADFSGYAKCSTSGTKEKLGKIPGPNGTMITQEYDNLVYGGRYTRKQQIRMQHETELTPYNTHKSRNLLKQAELLRTGPNGTVVNVKTKKEANELLQEAFPDYQKVNGVGSQDSDGPRRLTTMKRFKQGGAYRKDYAIDPKTSRVYGHIDENNPHGKYPHINIKRKDKTNVLINITGEK